MKCGSKCFLVEVEINGAIQTKRINARTPVSARKIVRGQYDEDIIILSAVEEKRNL